MLFFWGVSGTRAAHWSEVLWARLESVSFLTDDEKRIAIGYAAKEQGSATQRTSKIVIFRDAAALKARGPNLRLP
jgi:hypothetical protein